MDTATQRLKAAACDEGFSRVGVAPAVTPKGLHRFHEWLECGYAGEMSYLAGRQDAYAHPTHVLEGARSLVMLALDYRTEEPAPSQPGQGRVSRYAWGDADYHDVIHKKLRRLRTRVRQLWPAAAVRGVVDTAPLLEREFAQLAGLGWQGKHTLLINPTAGSYFFLAALIVDVELDYDTPFVADHCGECTACLDACPTNAFPQPYVLDASRCISYLSIELKSMVPEPLRPSIGDWLFGCDICQDVCPWNRFSAESHEAGFRARTSGGLVELQSLFSLGEEAFRAIFRRTPLWRPKRRGLLRNAAIALANNATADSIAALKKGSTDGDAVVRDTCAWAIQQLSS